MAFEIIKLTYLLTDWWHNKTQA